MPVMPVHNPIQSGSDKIDHYQLEKRRLQLVLTILATAAIIMYFVKINGPWASFGSVEAFECGKSGHNFHNDERIPSPWTALLLKRPENGRQTAPAAAGNVIVGGGVIVGPYTVISTGQGLRSQSDLLVGVGIKNSRNITRDRFTQFLEPEYIYPKPSGVSIIQLKNPIRFSSRVRPICIANGTRGTSLDFRKQPKLLSGYRVGSQISNRNFRPGVDGDDGDGGLTKKGLDDSWTWNGRQGEGCSPKDKGQDEEDGLLPGSVFGAWREGRWHLIGLVNNSGPVRCEDGLSQFVRPVEDRELNWIHATVKNGGKGVFTCSSGDSISLTLVCDGKRDCKGTEPEDEELSVCQKTEQEFIPQNRESQRRTSPPPSSTARTVPVTPETIILLPIPCPPPPSPPASDGIYYQCTPPRPSNSTTTISATTGRTANCVVHPWAPGTRLVAKCAPNYRPAVEPAPGEKTRVCGADGVWKPAPAKPSNSSELKCVLDCGRPQIDIGNRILNGTQTHSNWPWNAALFKVIKGKGAPTLPGYEYEDLKYICGGTLITPGAIVTAAHCVTYVGTSYAENPETFRVVLAPTSSKYNHNFEKGSLSQAVTIASIPVHDNYFPKTFEADIAILKLRSAAKISSQIYPICIPTSGRTAELSERRLTRVGSVGTVLGFGLDTNAKISTSLQVTSLPIVGPRECQATSGLFPTVSQLCAGSPGTSVCNGDSGGGLVFQEQGDTSGYGSFFIQGIVSHRLWDRESTALGCELGKYSIFTRVGAFKSWIWEVLTES